MRHGARHGSPSQAIRAANEMTHTRARARMAPVRPRHQLREVRGGRRRTIAGATLHIHSGAVNFEKWQALGNDYLIVEASDLPFELTPGRIQAICAPHTGVFADGILLLSEADERGFVARLRIFNPDGSEAE